MHLNPQIERAPRALRARALPATPPSSGTPIPAATQPPEQHLETVQLGEARPPTPGCRPASEAVEFQTRFDRQLGLSEVMAREKAQVLGESAHTFFRGSPALFYRDLEGPFRDQASLLPQAPPDGPVLGDAHLVNAGSFRGPDGLAVWGLNDFDQAEVGPLDRDLLRMATSLRLAGKEAQLDEAASSKLTAVFVGSYLNELGQSGPSYLRAEEAGPEVRKLLEKVAQRPADRMLERYLDSSTGGLVRNDELYDPEPLRGAQVQQALAESFPELTIKDLASRPHSGGSTRGLERYLALVEDEERPWLLEVKAVLPSPVQVQDGDLSRGDGNHVLEMTSRLGGLKDGRHRAFRLGETAFFTREREAEKGSVKPKADRLCELAGSVGRLLARAHSDSSGAVLNWIDGRSEALIENLHKFGSAYADQVESDLEAWRLHHRLAPSAPATNSLLVPTDPGVSTSSAGGFLLVH